MSDAPVIKWDEFHHEWAGEKPPATSILLIYTGGTIGAVPSDRADDTSPLTVASWEEFNAGVPALDALRGKGVAIDAIALRKPLDSTDVQPAYWTSFVQEIRSRRSTYDGFVLLHGTDTMVYTACALSFMLRGLGKPLVLTGSQIPILGHPHSDGVRNLVNAIRVAAWKAFGLPCVAEVCIAFDKLLLRGNRARKIEADGLGGFDSPNFPPLGEFQESVKIFPERLWEGGPFAPLEGLASDIMAFKAFPGIQSGSAFAGLLRNESLMGLVLEAYGTGNAPTDPEFLGLLKAATTGDEATGRPPISILDVTQCVKGTVRLGQYETGIGLLEAGVMSGSDLTPEAALCKLMVFLGNPRRVGEAQRLLQRSLAGEQSESIYTADLVVETEADGAAASFGGAGARLDLVSEDLAQAGWGGMRVASAWLHLYDAALTGGDDRGRIAVEVHTSASGGELTSASDSFVVLLHKSGQSAGGEEEGLVTFDLSAATSRITDPPNLTLVLRTEGRVRFSRAKLVVIVNDRVQGG